ncbi:hypothetical protein [Actinoplanes sp. NPDC026619]|uniref:hypothetical protein n=1 Tax=Actinoplanes sp. NPDC026619 TaxID=3155798 RepID=UPI0033F1C8E2
MPAGLPGDRFLPVRRGAVADRLELHRQLLVDPEELQVLLVFTAAPGSSTDAKIRLRTAASD